MVMMGLVRQVLTQLGHGGNEMVGRVGAHGCQGEAGVGGREVEGVAASGEVAAALWVGQLVGCLLGHGSGPVANTRG